VIRGWWLIDPADGVPHAWHHVLDGNIWQSLCDREAAPTGLLDPPDEFGRCPACALALTLEHGADLPPAGRARGPVG
jgi:hypothetical protein